MAFETILYDVDAGVATITLNRPDQMNTWTNQMAGELSAALDQANEDDAVRVVVVTGAGRAFCAGADLSGGGGTFGGRDERNPGEQEARRGNSGGVPNTLPWDIDKPVVAAVNGHAIGVGITYPMTCDMRIIAEDAKVQFAFVRRGVIPELASHMTVARVAGLSNAADVLLSGRKFTGREAAEIGIASKALPAAEVLPAAQAWARDVAANAAPVSVAVAKRLIWEGLNSTPKEMMKRENPIFAWAGNQPDAKEGVTSFLEKRPPQWTLSATKNRPPSL